MSFSVFAYGTNHFNYRNDNFIDAGTFEPLKIVSTLMTMSPTAAGGAGSLISHKSPGIADLAGSIATMEFLHMLNDSVSFLSMCAGSNEGGIALSTTQTHALWPDTKGFAKYKFHPGDDPGAEFIKLAGPDLKQTDLNNWGALAALALVLSKFYAHIGSEGKPVIMISLSH